MDQKIDLASLNLEEIVSFIVGIGEPKFRAKQLYDWINKGKDFLQMPNIPKALIKKLEDNGAYIAKLEIEKKLVSSDGTIKYLFSTVDGEKIETVLMRYEHGNTVCISTEAGCSMGCKFCASTLNGLSRRLLPSEMLFQVVMAQNDAGVRVSNVVLMGIGEPLDNYDNVIKFLHLVGDEGGLNIGYRHISLSTCGLVDKIETLSNENLPITLSISLHASDDEIRSSLMPINKKWNIESLLTKCSEYFDKTGRRISFEYTLISGKNDSTLEAEKLSSVLRKYCSNMPLHVNLIPVNDVTERGLKPSDKKAVDLFVKTLEKNHIVATVRRKLGNDINASCGQLRYNSNKK